MVYELSEKIIKITNVQAKSKAKVLGILFEMQYNFSTVHIKEIIQKVANEMHAEFKRGTQMKNSQNL